MDLLPLTKLVDDAIIDGAFPGAAYGIMQGGRAWVAAQGRYTYCPESPLITPETIWDMASVSKVVGTTTLCMLMHERGKLDLDAPVSVYLPLFGQNGKGHITVRNLLVHDSGLIAFRPYHRTCTRPEQVIERVNTEELTYPTGSKMVYSDLNMIAMAQILERLTGLPLDFALHEHVFRSIALKRTGYFRSVGPEESPAKLDPTQCAPTETIEPWRREQRRLRQAFLDATISEQKRKSGIRFPDQDSFIQGEVHDPTAMTLGGVAGHAGLFSTVGDLLHFMRSLLEGKIARKETVAEFTRKQSDLSSRALGWDTKSPEGSSAGTKFGPRSFGHTGYTGTSVWTDPERDLVVVLLTNRVHPTSENTKLLKFRPIFHDAVVQMIEG